MRCKYCNFDIPNGYKFCPQCGEKIKVEAPVYKEICDYIVAKCPTGQLNQCIDFYSSFGYEYDGNQMVYNQYQHFDGAISMSYNNFAATQVFTHVETTEFLSVTFKRSHSKLHYNELVEIERKYNSINLKRDVYKTGGFVFMFPVGGGVALLGLVFLIMGIGSYESLFSMIIMGTLFLVIGIAAVIGGISLQVLKRISKETLMSN